MSAGCATINTERGAAAPDPRGGKGGTIVTRAERLTDQMKLKAEEAAILSKPSNIFYLSGYTGEGFALVSLGVKAIVTDFRYVEQAGQEAPDYQTLGIEGSVSLLEKAYEALKREGIRTVYYEDDEFTVRSHQKAVGIFQGMDLKPLGGAVEQLRRVKDAEEIRRIELACKISSETFERVFAPDQRGNDGEGACPHPRVRYA